MHGRGQSKICPCFIKELGEYMKKTKAAATIMGKDGATSIFILKNNKHSLKQRWHRFWYERRKRAVEKSITSAVHHSMEEVVAYAMKEYGLVENSREDEEFQEDYRQLRTSFMLQHRPELLGEYANIPKPPNHEDPEVVMAFIEKGKKRVEYAMSIPKEKFDIDLHKLTKSNVENQDSLSVIIETKYGYIGGSAVGDKMIKEMNGILKSLYRYYGVTQEDIDNKTERYKNLVRELSRK